ncbi:MAG: hypothetical protein EOO10_07690 [Chitinophagaceae bacterium]|nr:MAG: hypothetical protein EOO10_07690 [Chitinophagaceae bacterium]
MKTFNLLLILFLPNLLAAQEKEMVIVAKGNEEIVKHSLHTELRIQAFEKGTGSKIYPIIVRIDKVSVSCDTSGTATIIVKKGKHKIQIGAVGFNYTNTHKLRTNTSKNYEVAAYLTPAKGTQN